MSIPISASTVLLSRSLRPEAVGLSSTVNTLNRKHLIDSNPDSEHSFGISFQCEGLGLTRAVRDSNRGMVAVGVQFVMPGPT
ncbi:hypothetical protein VNO77_27730 [Canavalia gladiata]|uniref:Uncharacterized protein n=1 Tax=Canavalia gladiata TaxID=3824 RepID=A0AAN9KYD4_CANGL